MLKFKLWPNFVNFVNKNIFWFFKNCFKPNTLSETVEKIEVSIKKEIHACAYWMSHIEVDIESYYFEIYPINIFWDSFSPTKNSN